MKLLAITSIYCFLFCFRVNGKTSLKPSFDYIKKYKRGTVESENVSPNAASLTVWPNVRVSTFNQPKTQRDVLGQTPVASIPSHNTPETDQQNAAQIIYGASAPIQSQTYPSSSSSYPPPGYQSNYGAITNHNNIAQPSDFRPSQQIPSYHSSNPSYEQQARASYPANLYSMPVAQNNQYPGPALKSNQNSGIKYPANFQTLQTHPAYYATFPGNTYQKPAATVNQHYPFAHNNGQFFVNPQSQFPTPVITEPIILNNALQGKFILQNGKFVFQPYASNGVLHQQNFNNKFQNVPSPYVPSQFYPAQKSTVPLVTTPAPVFAPLRHNPQVKEENEENKDQQSSNEESEERENQEEAEEDEDKGNLENENEEERAEEEDEEYSPRLREDDFKPSAYFPYGKKSNRYRNNNDEEEDERPRSRYYYNEEDEEERPRIKYRGRPRHNDDDDAADETHHTVVKTKSKPKYSGKTNHVKNSKPSIPYKTPPKSGSYYVSQPTKKVESSYNVSKPPVKYENFYTYKFSKVAKNKPKDQIEGRHSNNVPITDKTTKHYQANWFVSKSNAQSQ